MLQLLIYFHFQTIMNPWAFLLLIIFGLCCVLAFFSMLFPKTLWWTLEAWKYQNPEANEPSDSAYTYGRIGSAVMLAVSLWLLTLVPKVYGPKPPPPKIEFTLPPFQLPDAAPNSSLQKTPNIERSLRRTTR